MRNLILFGLLIILLLVAQFTSAKTVEDVIEKYLKARGGSNKLAAIKSIYMEGLIEKAGSQAIIKITMEQDKLSRINIAWPHENNRVQVADSFDRPALQTELDIDGPLVEYLAKGHKAELLGKEKVEDNTCYKIKLTTKDGNKILLWIDASTWLLNQSWVLKTNETSGVKNEVFTLLRNYKDVDGIKFAHTFETRTNAINRSNDDEEISFNKIILNPHVDPPMYLQNNQS